MKKLLESILDNEDEIMDQADQAAYIAAGAEWLKQHLDSNHIDGVSKYPDRYPNIYSGGVWHLEHDTLTIGKKDEIPEWIKIDKLKGLVIAANPMKALPDNIYGEIDYLTIRNCPNLESLKGCPEKVKKFAVSGCPKIKKLDGCPKESPDLFKFIHNGVVVTDKDIKKYCKVDKKNMIYGQ